ncbi:transposase [Ponticoccus alexandrii]|uniref:Transposase zinc-ribbon domain-containing protein n=1 Tax=Ponticoccus alexandrii TaxID=1943633 RepID=A0ABX7F4X7_9RHOB|nr:transposase [Ponticoccus alexandrii]QRF65539.1 hypothetical protein GQA70_03920 [Ponticoccus alexandrii]
MLKGVFSQTTRDHWKLLSTGLPEGGIESLFATEIECVERMEALLWPEGRDCPRCRSKKFWLIKERNLYECANCSHQFSPWSSTPMAKRKVGLKSCMLGAEFLIVTMAAGRTEIQTIQKFAKVTGLSYRPARDLRSSMCEELSKLFGGFWGGMVCVNEMDITHYVEDRLDALRAHYGFDVD